MAGKPKVTESVFRAVKTLIAGGATLKECAEYMKLNPTTISIIKSSETYEEYRNKMYVNSSWYRKKTDAEQKKKEEDAKPVQVVEPEKQEPPKQVVEYRQNVTIQATHYMMEEMKKTNELLTLISNKLAYLLDSLMK